VSAQSSASGCRTRGCRRLAFAHVEQAASGCVHGRGPVLAQADRSFTSRSERLPPSTSVAQPLQAGAEHLERLSAPPAWLSPPAVSFRQPKVRQRLTGKRNSGGEPYPAARRSRRAGKVNAPPRPMARLVFDTWHQGPDGRRYQTPGPAVMSETVRRPLRAAPAIHPERCAPDHGAGASACAALSLCLHPDFARCHPFRSIWKG
jgi:hypothetical protein